MTLEAVVRVPAPTGRFRRTLAAAQVHRWSLVVWGAMSAWSAALFIMARADYENFRLARYDLGNMVQAVWNTAHGHFLQSTDLTGEQTVRLGNHVDPILALLTPLWLVAPSPLTLAAAQIGGCALGALPVFWLGRRHLGSELGGAMAALLYLAYPWLAWTALDAMHPATLAIPLFLFAIWFLDEDRPWAFALCAALALATNELAGLTLAALGLWYGFSYRRARRGALIAFAGIAWTLLALALIIPQFRGGPSPYYAHYEAVGGSPENMVRTAFTDPGAYSSALSTSHNLAYVFLLAAPLSGAFLLAPGLAAVALPRLLENGLSDRPTSADPRAHYVDAILPFLVAAAIFGLARLPERRRLALAFLVLAVSVSWFVAAGPRPGAFAKSPIHYTNLLPTTRVSALRAAVALVPDGVPVSSSNDVGAHLAARRYAATVPVVGRARWIVVDTRDPAVPAFPVSRSDPARIRRFVAEVESDSRWQKVFDRDGVLVFRRTGE